MSSTQTHSCLNGHWCRGLNSGYVFPRLASPCLTTAAAQISNCLGRVKIGQTDRNSHHKPTGGHDEQNSVDYRRPTFTNGRIRQNGPLLSSDVFGGVGMTLPSANIVSGIVESPIVPSSRRRYGEST